MFVNRFSAWEGLALPSTSVPRTPLLFVNHSSSEQTQQYQSIKVKINGKTSSYQAHRWNEQTQSTDVKPEH